MKATNKNSDVRTEQEKIIIEILCEEVAKTGESLETIVKFHPEWNMDKATPYLWLKQNKHGFQDKYVEYLRCTAFKHAESAIKVANNVDLDKNAISKAKLQVKVHLWHAERLLPKIYGQTNKIVADVGVHESALQELK